MFTRVTWVLTPRLPDLYRSCRFQRNGGKSSQHPRAKSGAQSLRSWVRGVFEESKYNAFLENSEVFTEKDDLWDLRMSWFWNIFWAEESYLQKHPKEGLPAIPSKASFLPFIGPLEPDCEVCIQMPRRVPSSRFAELMEKDQERRCFINRALWILVA